jgi:hypothetical protein
LRKENESEEANYKAQYQITKDNKALAIADKKSIAEGIALANEKKIVEANEHKFETQKFLKNASFQRQLHEAVKKAAAKAAHD